MHISISTTRAAARLQRFASQRGRSLATVAGGLSLAFAYAGHALAQATSPAGSIGDQLVKMSGEGLNSGSTVFGTGLYLAAAICFFFGVWSLWQGRQPQNRENGHMTRGLAGLVLCGLLASGGVWINKAAITASGGNATVTTTPGMVNFSAGG